MQIHAHDGQKWLLTEAPCCGLHVLVPWSCLFALPNGLDLPHCGREWTLHAWIRHPLPSVEWTLNKAALRLVQT